MMTIKVTVDRIEGEKVVLKTEDNETIIWPKSKLSNDIHEGMALVYVIMNSEEAEKSNRELAKDILNEILDVEGNKM